MTSPYPPYEPYDRGMLDTGDGNRIYWDVSGNPDGKPAVNLHGGPGAGGGAKPISAWDPERYRVIRFDQRNCGRSTPHAADPAADMSLNTTEHLLSDMELLREHLGVDRWLVKGGSWGATLALAYAQRHPERVTEMILISMMTSRRSELDWLYRGAGRFAPEAWQRFRDGVPVADREGDLLSAYARLMENPDPEVRSKAAADWMAWEDTVLTVEQDGTATDHGNQASATQQAFVRICAHYFSNAAWLQEGVLIQEAGRLAGIPGVIIQGRQDLGCPPMTAWELAQAWPDARLVIVEDAGHTGSPTMQAEIQKAIEQFAGRN
ncbi:prolyl aminopeptidase [Streptomyces sp. NPDC056231]|uniref:prolyl aminopeptidase n=1 Tax=Streptomyces sp. NPDC056231 TaxID=3345755 RepID=UPI003AAFC00B